MVGPAGGIEFIQEPTHHLVREIGRGLVTLHHRFEASGPVLGLRDHVLVDEVLFGHHVPANLRHIVQVAVLPWWNAGLVKRIPVEGPAVGIEREVRLEDARREKQRPARRLLHGFFHPFHRVAINQFPVMDAPVERGLGQRPFPVAVVIRLRRTGGPHIKERLERRVARTIASRRAVMEDLTRPHGGVPVPSEMLRQGHNVGEQLAPGVLVSVHAARRGMQAGKNRCARGVAGGCDAIRAAEEGAAGGQAFQVGRLDRVIRIEQGGPVVHVVDGDKQDIRPLVGGGS